MTYLLLFSIFHLKENKLRNFLIMQHFLFETLDMFMILILFLNFYSEFR